jgi:hypothetical protein
MNGSQIHECRNWEIGNEVVQFHFVKQWLSSELPMRFLSPIVKVFCPSREETHISKFNVRLDSSKKSEKAGLLKFTLWPLLQKVSTRVNPVLLLRQTF